MASCRCAPINKAAFLPFSHPVRRIWILHFAFFSRSPRSLSLPSSNSGRKCMLFIIPALSLSHSWQINLAAFYTAAQLNLNSEHGAKTIRHSRETLRNLYLRTHRAFELTVYLLGRLKRCLKSKLGLQKNGIHRITNNSIHDSSWSLAM